MIRLFRLTGAGEGSHDRDMERMQPLAKEQLNLIQKIENKTQSKIKQTNQKEAKPYAEIFLVLESKINY
jgi:hypothetical protein